MKTERTAGLSDIFNEVEEDLRREEYLKLWRRYGRAALAIFVGTIVAVTVYVIWGNYREGVRKDQSAQYHEILSADPALEGTAREAAFAKLADELSGSYKVLAQLELAAVFVSEQKYAEAIALYSAIAENSGVDQSLRDSARLKSGLLQAETSTLAEMRALVGAMAAPAHPYRFTAGELLGYVAFRTEDLAAAEGYLSAIRDDANVPPNTRQRVGDFLAFIAGKGGTSAAAPAADQGAAPPTNDDQQTAQ